jgi:hypothetical protein
MKSGTGPLSRTIAPRTKMVPKLPSTVRCDKQSAYLGKRLAIPNCLRSVTNLLLLVGLRVPSTERKALGLRRAWLSIPPPPAMPTTARIVTAAVTRSRPTARTRKCTSKVINMDNHGPRFSSGCKPQQLSKVASKASSPHCLVHRALQNLMNFSTEDLCITSQESMGRSSIFYALFRLAFSTGGGCMFLRGVFGTA